MEWNEDVIGRLRELWAEGHSTAEIGRRLGVSKNAIVGKAHRLELPARPSPIRREGGEQAAERRTAPRRVEGPTLPPLATRSRAGRGRCADAAARAAEGTATASRSGGPAAAATGLVAPLRPYCDLLLADRRTRHEDFPLLRRSLRAGEALLRRSCQVGLCESPRPPRGRGLSNSVGRLGLSLIAPSKAAAYASAALL